MASIIAALTGLVIAVSGTLARARIISEVAAVKSEVTTANGQTIAALADAVEGRRIRSDVERHERTRGQQDYVDALDVPGDESRRGRHGDASPEAPG